MLYDIVLIAVGFALVAKGGDLFVDSSVHIGRALRIPRFVIGGTLVSLATTGPELVVSATASWMGDSGIALGNAVGSCICNIGLIVGTVALIMPVQVDKPDFIRRAAWMVGGGLLVVGVLLGPVAGSGVRRRAAGAGRCVSGLGSVGHSAVAPAIGGRYGTG